MLFVIALFEMKGHLLPEEATTDAGILAAIHSVILAIGGKYSSTDKKR
ncbi:MAG: hypothetical protein ORN54_15370 [Cyclobacteriaceae bacterium]|nr:hypothetical protein [Cyclobacteriaceae bacterium]